MSANGEQDVVLRGIVHGAVDYLIKPVRVEELRNVAWVGGSGGDGGARGGGGVATQPCSPRGSCAARTTHPRLSADAAAAASAAAAGARSCGSTW